MAALEGYLKLEDDSGLCAELVHDCRTLSFLRNHSAAGWRTAIECDNCCCEDIDPCEYTTVDGEENPAPWYDPAQPASTEFLGLYGSLNLAQPTNFGGVVPPRTLTFTGVLMATTKRGKVFGMDWLSSVLTPLCVSCTGRQATVYAFCPSECDDGTIVIDPEEPGNETVAPVTLDLSEFYDETGCELDIACDPLPPSDIALLEAADDGQRQLLRVLYVPASLQELEMDFPNCYGCRVTFQFTIADDESFLDGMPICEISPADSDVQPPPTSPCVVSPDDSDGGTCGACGVACACEDAPTPTTADTATSNTLADGAAECRYSAPLLSQRYACLTDANLFEQSAPVINIHSGSEEMTNARVTFYQAITGLPNPMSALGGDIYATRQPEATALITRIPAGSTLTIDGRSNQTTLTCPGFGTNSGSPLVSECDNRRFRAPRFCCGNRYWVVIEVDCYTTTHDDWRLTGAIHGVERS